MAHISDLAKRAKAASRRIAALSEAELNAALEAMAQSLLDNTDEILLSNAKDIEYAESSGISKALIDRLLLSKTRIEGMANGIRKVAALPTPLGAGSTWNRPSGLVIERTRVPLGLVGVIYESRPNVTSDVAALCLKSGNACLLRGGKEAINSNRAIAAILRAAIKKENIPEDAISFVDDTSRETANEMMKLHGILDLLIPRGGGALIKAVVENSNVPVIETGMGNCHIYAHNDCDLDMAVNVITTAKCSRPSVCNALETLLVHRDIAKTLLPALKTAFTNVELRGCAETLKIIGITPATDLDYETEYNDYILAIKIVGSLEEAVEHVNKYSTGHSESILTRDIDSAKHFTSRVDSAAVYVNVSTRFTDGEEFGLGAEIGTSTAKLHARGPMGIEALTCEKYIIYGNGQTR